MKFRPVGICSEAQNALHFMRASDFSNAQYDGIELRSGRNGIPVIVMRSKKTAPLMWKVVYGYSQVYFRTFSEAVEFCNSRGMKLVKDQLEKR